MLLLSSSSFTAMLILLAQFADADLNDSLSAASPLQNTYGGYIDSTTSTGDTKSLISYTSPIGSSNGTVAAPANVNADIQAESLWQYQNAVAILAYGSPPLLFLANFGNTMSVITLQHPSFRKSSTSFILSALAIVDLVYVDIGLTRQWTLELTMELIRPRTPEWILD